MSKSMGNVIPPSQLIEKFGADIIRLWVSSEDYRNDLRIGLDMMNQIADSYRKIRNTFKFIIGNLSDFAPERALPYAGLLDIDKWILHELHDLSGRCSSTTKNSNFTWFTARYSTSARSSSRPFISTFPRIYSTSRPPIRSPAIQPDRAPRDQRGAHAPGGAGAFLYRRGGMEILRKDRLGAYTGIPPS